MTRDAREVRVLENVTGAVGAGPLAVPHAENAVVLRLREQVGELATVDRRRPEIFVHTREEDDVVLAEQGGVALKREIETTERGAPIPGDERGGIEPSAFIGSVLIERQAHQRLDAREEGEPLFLTGLGVQGGITLFCPGVSSRRAERIVRAAPMRRQTGLA